MGIKSVFQFKVSTTETQPITEMQKRIELFQPQKQEKWTVSTSLYLSTKQVPLPNEAKELFATSFDEQPSCYLMVKNQILAADKDMLTIVEKIKSFKLRQTVTITGSQYMIGDFMVRVGAVMLGTNTKGLVMETEYVPCNVINKCTEILDEFTSLFGPYEHTTPSIVQYGEVEGLPAIYSSQHTTFQYVTLFKSMGLLN